MKSMMLSLLVLLASVASYAQSFLSTDELDYLPNRGIDCKNVVSFSDGIECGADAHKVWRCDEQLNGRTNPNVVYYLISGYYESSVPGHCAKPMFKTTNVHRTVKPNIGIKLAH